MLILSILYVTVAISLSSLIPQRWSKLGSVILLNTLILSMDSTHLSSQSISSLSLYNGFLIDNLITITLDSLLILISLFLIFPYFSFISFFSSAYKKNYAGITSLNPQRFTLGKENIIFYLCTLIGSIILIGSGDLLVLLLGIELQSYSLYLIATSSGSLEGFNINNNIKEPAEAAGLKYYLLGALASALILIGIAILYAVFGTTNLYSIGNLLASDSSLISFSSGMGEINLNSEGFVPQHIYSFELGIFFILIGFIWKFAGAPLHNWAIDVYDAVPTYSSSWLAIIPKIALLTITSEIIYLFFIPQDFSIGLHSIDSLYDLEGVTDSYSSAGVDSSLSYVTNQTNFLILFVSSISLIIGAIGALTQPLIKRLLAYSSVGQIGFILLGIGLMAQDSALFYLIQYTITNTGLWLCLLISSLYILNPLVLKETSSMSILNPLVLKETSSMSILTKEGDYPSYPLRDRRSEDKDSGKVTNCLYIKNKEQGLVKDTYIKNLNRDEIRNINELQGLHIHNIFIALAFTLLFFSTAGIPPMIGFFAKFEIISTALNSGHFALSLLAITASLISATYYIKVIRVIWFHFSGILPNRTNLGDPLIPTQNRYFYLESFTAFVISLITLASTFYILQGKVVLTWCKLFVS